MYRVLFASAICLLALSSRPAVASPTDGIVAYYPLEGTLSDMSGNGHHGVPFGDGISYTRAVVHWGADFDGLWGTGVDTGTWSPSSATGEFSVACWLRYRTGGNSRQQGLIGKRNDGALGQSYWYLEIEEATDGNSVESVYFAGSQGLASTPNYLIQDGVWRFVVGTYDGATARLYVDANEFASEQWTLDPQDAGNRLVFGCSGNNGQNPLSGTLDEVIIWDRSLGYSEIIQLFNAGQGVDLILDRDDIIYNAGFEERSLSDGQQWEGDVLGWGITGNLVGSRGTYNPTAADFVGEAPEGNNVMWSSNLRLRQILNILFEAGFIYRLEVKVGSRQGEVGQYGISMRSLGTSLTSTGGQTTADGTFESVVLDYAPYAGDPAIGTAIRVILTHNDNGTGSRGYFDDVQLTKLQDSNGNGIPDIDEDLRVNNITQDTWYLTIQNAINAAVDGDEIVVEPGTYTESIDFLRKAIYLRSSGGRRNTTIDGTGHLHVVQCVNYESSDTILEGFTITGGNASGDGTGSDSYGGGMYNLFSTPTVINCAFRYNTAYQGAGMYNDRSSPTVIDCIFRSNTADLHGGGMFNTAENPIITGCIFRDNFAAGSGGGIYNRVSSPSITECKFAGNTANAYDGGGVYFDKGTPTVAGCSFERNAAGRFGGGVSQQNSVFSISNCIFAGNTSGIRGGGLYSSESNSVIANSTFDINASGSGGAVGSFGGDLELSNCTFTVNNSQGSDALYYDFSLSGGPGKVQISNCIIWDGPEWLGVADWVEVSVDSSDIEGGWDGLGSDNISTDPNFVNLPGDDGVLGTLDDDLRLLPVSPCIDAGNSLLIPSDISDVDRDHNTDEAIPVDLDGNPRLMDDPATPDTGNTIFDWPVVDMGAYEFQPEGQAPIPCHPAVEGDVNCDGAVDLRDLALMSANWLRSLD